jgi:putative Ca2+/H+ antiporter (TMEM165/GDT1 family)
VTVVDPVAIAVTFGLVIPAELPDKTFISTLVLATRYRPRPVWLGATAAFVVQSLVAVTAGGLVARLPRTPVLAVTAGLFTIGAVLLVRAEERDPEGAEEVTEVEEATRQMSRSERSDMRIAGLTFGVLFAAEWGDFSQLLTAGLAARYNSPISVFVGALCALTLIAALAVVAGRKLLTVLPLAVIRRSAGVLFGLLAVVTAVEAAGVHPF